MHSPVLKSFLIISFALYALADIYNSPINIVTDETRYRATHPDAIFVPFKKTRHVKGNYVFTAGERIDGEIKLGKYYDQATFTKSEDVEVFLKYLSKTEEEATLNSIEIFADINSEDADVFFVKGGIGHTFAEMILAGNQTSVCKYEINVYGY